ncbi:MAG: extracellular solute-binding protein [Thermomicrobiales bacterium]|nr:extracellular solute-binding protein [Thermomicrobiales bacterium]MCO5220380.1 extracellular solute-binding protein [Thermomicrobiales bacterium]
MLRGRLFRATSLALTLLLASAFLVPGLGPVATAQDSGSLTLWHGWTGAEADTLNNQIIPAWQEANPGIEIDVLAVPFDQLKNKYQTEAATGGGPDLLIGPADWVGELAEAELILPLDDLVGEDVLAQYVESAVDALRIDGQLYGLPESVETVALYYNTDLVPTAPASTADLISISAEIAAADSGNYGLALFSNFYHPAGYLFGWGGQIFDDTNHSAFDAPETVSFLGWMKDLTSQPGVYYQNDDAAISSLFKEGKAGMVINGPWALADYQAALGADKVAVAELPVISENGDAPAKPFLGVKHIMVNSNDSGDQAALAARFAEFFTGAEVGKILADGAGHLPANTGVDVSENPAASAFVAQAANSTPMPTIPQMGQVWTPAEDMIGKVLAGDATPEEAAASAAQSINDAIDLMDA